MEGIQQLQSDYKGSTLYVYLDGISNKDFIKDVEEQYGDDIVETLDIDENIESQTGMYISCSVCGYADDFNHYRSSCCHDSVSRHQNDDY